MRLTRPSDLRLCGCFYFPTPDAPRQPVPLTSVHVEGRLSDMIQAVTLTQNYTNSESTAVTVEYTFPIEEGVAVRDFVASIDGVKLKGKVMEKNDAKDVFDNAVASGDGAYLGGQAKDGDLFVVKLGNLPPGATVAIELTWVAEVDAQGPNGLRWILPTVLMPRYNAEPHTPTSGGAPAIRAQGSGGVKTKPPPPYTFKLNVSSSRPIGTISCSSHSTEAVKITNTSETVAVVESAAPLPNEKDLVLAIDLAGNPAPFVRVETDAEGRPTAAMLSFFPDEAEDAEEDAVKNEVWFLLDRSGSMSGSPITAAVEALQLFLRSLTPGTTFNIMSFGSRHTKLWSSPKAYSDVTLKQASDAVATMKADLGGTVLLNPLNEIFNAKLDASRMRQVIVLTDGAVSNTDSVIAACSQAAKEGTRVFTLGVGNGVSTQLVRGMARAGRGVAEFTAQGESIGPKIIRQASIALSPSYDLVTAAWTVPGVSAPQNWISSVVSQEPLDVNKDGPVRTPSGIPAVFRESRTTLYWLWNPTGGQSPLAAPPSKVTFDASHSKGWSKALKFELTIDPALHVLPPGRSTTIAKLAARAMIADLEEASSSRGDHTKLKERIVAMSIAHNISSRETSYVAVEERDSPATDAAKLRIIPTSTVGANRPQRLLGGRGGGGGMMRMSMASSLAPQSAGYKGAPRMRNASGAASYAAPASAKSKKSGGFGAGFSSFSLSGMFGGGKKSGALGAPGHVATFGGPKPMEGAFNRKSRSRESSTKAKDMHVNDSMDDDESEGSAPVPPPAPAPASSSAARPSSPPTPAPPSGSDYTNVVMQQAATGSWASVPAGVAASLGGADKINAACPGGAPSGEAATAWATAIVIAWLEIKQASHASELALVLAKAKKWLRKVNSGAHSSFLDAATSFVSSS